MCWRSVLGCSGLHKKSGCTVVFGRQFDKIKLGMAAKGPLRKLMGKKLLDMDAQVLQDGSLRCLQRVQNMKTYIDCTAMCCFLSMPVEMQTDSILCQAFLDGKRVFVPKVTGPGRGDMEIHEVFSMDEIRRFPKTKWGIPEPPDSARCFPVEEYGAVDLVLVPGVAFDNACRRLGHGKGYYDTFLSRLVEAHAAVPDSALALVGVAFDEQITEEVPISDHDRMLDFVVTPSGIFTRNGKVSQLLLFVKVERDLTPQEDYKLFVRQ